MIILPEEMRKDTLKVYRDVLLFLGVKNTTFVPDLSVRNPRSVPKSVFLAKHLKNPPYVIRKTLKLLFPLTARKKMSMFLNSVLQKRDTSRLNPETKKELQKRFFNEVKNLDKLLHDEGFLPKNRSLIEIWGYDRLSEKR